MEAIDGLHIMLQFFSEVFLLEPDAVVEALATLAALGDEVQAHGADVLRGVEVLGAGDGLALDFEL